ncbi:hypothetical protein J2Y48_000139 [Mycoplana sp. BE70]|uniref:hypothetical protein n=1 Tax=Mycoplana sp. BE70 TaxID=2817775 RepID=UPI00285F245D|nr:hypothetical protein [Mycoplana sp. BE70]MDR6754866.1 hypothetical protein [Mycoplana sp. BE70]
MAVPASHSRTISAIVYSRPNGMICHFRPSTIEGVHLKAEMMLQALFIVECENDDYFTQAERISGFLPPD